MEKAYKDIGELNNTTNQLNIIYFDSLYLRTSEYTFFSMKMKYYKILDHKKT